VTDGRCFADYFSNDHLKAGLMIEVESVNTLVTVVILTKNPGMIFQEVLASVLQQRTPWKYEVMIVDSGSTDGTVEHVLSHAEVQLLQIAPMEFGHGRTRNFAVQSAKGKYVAMLTHDAKPANEEWLANLVAPLEENKSVAGVFGRHLAYPSASAYTKRDLAAHFDGFLAWPRIMGMDDKQRYREDRGYRQVLHYFSDNNACLRKSVWERLPYPEVDFAEDQLWAKAVIEHGYYKAYANGAAVFHSHDYSLVDTFRRSFDESRALFNLFGYVLCPSFSEWRAQIYGCTRRDILYLRENGGAFANLKLLAKTPALHLARQSGFALGRYQGGMRSFVFRIFSLDASIKRKKAKNAAPALQQSLVSSSKVLDLKSLMLSDDDEFVSRVFYGLSNRSASDTELVSCADTLKAGGLRIDLLLRHLDGFEEVSSSVTQRQAAEYLRTQLAGFAKLHIDDKFFVESAICLCARRNSDLGWLSDFLTESPTEFIAYACNALYRSMAEESVVAQLSKKLDDGVSRVQVLMEAMGLRRGDKSVESSSADVPAPWRTLLGLLSLEGTTFVASAYQFALGRKADHVGAAAYKKHMEEGTTKLQIVFELLSSAEGRDVSAKADRDGVDALETIEEVDSQPSLESFVPGNKIDVLAFYDFVLTKAVEPIYSNPFHNAIRKNSINWIIPDFGIGSGGHLNIFRHVFLLEKRGYKNNICIVGTKRHNNPEHARDMIRDHFFPLTANVYFDVETLPSAYYSFATGWTTAYYLNGFGKTAIKLYFIQDFEPYFFAKGSEYEFAEKTYTLGFAAVCAGQWLANTMTKNYATKSHAIGFSYDRKTYVRTARREPNVRRIFCYCRPPTVRRGLETALLALNIVGRELPDVEFVLAGWDMGAYHFPHRTLNAGLLRIDELPDLYSQCDVALVLSNTNLSLLPIELMACGCPVVSNRGKNTEWLLNSDNSVLVDNEPLAIANALINVLNDDQLRLGLSQRAMEFAKSTSWERESDGLVRFLEELAR